MAYLAHYVVHALALFIDQFAQNTPKLTTFLLAGLDLDGVARCFDEILEVLFCQQPVFLLNLVAGCWIQGYRCRTGGYVA